MMCKYSVTQTGCLGCRETSVAYPKWVEMAEAEPCPALGDNGLEQEGAVGAAPSRPWCCLSGFSAMKITPPPHFLQDNFLDQIFLTANGDHIAGFRL